METVTLKRTVHCDPIDAVNQLFKRLAQTSHESALGYNVSVGLKQPECWKEGMAKVGLLYDDAMLKHQGRFGEFEKPGRVSVPFRFLTREGTIGRCFTMENRPACTSDLALSHSVDYINRIANGDVKLSEDVFWCQHTDECARVAAGCSIAAVDLVLNSYLDSAFALIRPPGHHAEHEMARGFCFYNNAAIAAYAALRNESSCRRIVILDWDVHHGNGTQNLFYEDDRVMYISLHRGGQFFPGTGFIDQIGEGKGTGYNVNIPWPGIGFGNADYLFAFQVIVEPLISAANPDLTIISAGFDAVVHDPLGGLLVTPECFGHLTQRILNISPKTVMLLEGGYNLIQLTSCISSCVRVLLGDDPQPTEQSHSPLPATKDVLDNVAKQLSPHWPCLEPTQVERRMQDFCMDTL